MVQAINIALGNRESMMATLQENVEALIRQEDEISSEGIEAKLLELQKKLLKQMKRYRIILKLSVGSWFIWTD